jgi:hypothetical protein
MSDCCDVQKERCRVRLIDADAMLKRNEHSIYDTTDLKEMLDYEPTVYDVDKVVEQIKENVKEKCACGLKCKGCIIESNCGIIETISIVKGAIKDE